MTEIPATPTARRNPIGWIVLAILFALNVFAAAQGATEEKKSDPYASAALTLRMTASQRSLLKMAGGDKRLEEQTSESLANVAADLADDAKKNPDAARLYAAIRTERGKPVPSEMLKPLQDSKSEADRALARIYGAEKLDRATAERLNEAIPNDPFVYRLAKVQALEKAGDKAVRAQRIPPDYAIKIVIAMLIGFGVLASGLTMWFVYAYLRSQGKLAPLGHPAGTLTLAQADALAIRAAVLFVAFSMLQIVSTAAPTGALRAVLLLAALLGVLMLVIRMPIGGERLSLEAMGLRREGMLRHVGWGIGGFLAELPLTLLAALIGLQLFSFLPQPSHPIQEQLQSGNIADLIAILLLAAVLAPIWEEAMFRGFLFPALGRIAGSVASGALYSSLAFGLIHPQGPALVLSLATVGAMSCLLAHQTRSLIPSIVMHALHNFTIVLLGWSMLGS